MDEIGNVTGYINGAAPRPKVMFDVHLDTVFGLDQPLSITEVPGQAGVYNCPGMSDNTAGMAMLLSVLRAIRHAGLVPVGRLMVVGAVRHEGEGDLAGMKTLYAKDREIDACFSTETLTRPGAIINTAIGVHRYEVVFTGPGGHSWLNFGRPNPIQALCRAGAVISDFIPPQEPQTTFNLGTVQGGVTVNSIPAECRAKLDIRSVSNRVLQETDDAMQHIIRGAVAAENARWPGDSPVRVEFRVIGDRPGGGMAPDTDIVQVFWKATEAVGLAPHFWPPLGTNANVPLSLGVPALGFGGGGTGGNLHSPEEWYCHAGSGLHAGRLLLALFAMAGLEGVTEPLAALVSR
jgi:acetylornithine deacetylase/succinyl-diaminopimelate desuccinylase-like protein